MYWIQKKYINMVSGRLRNFVWRDSQQHVCHFACPFCGDSDKDTRKRRGILYLDPDDDTKELVYHFYCHNGCGRMAFGYFLYRLDASMASEFRMETFEERHGPRRKHRSVEEVARQSPRPVRVDDSSDPLTPISQLSSSHPARMYAAYRQLPIGRLFWCDDFAAYAKKFYAEDNLVSEGRLCMKMCDREGKVFGVIGRSIDKNAKMRYITLKADSNQLKVFGLDNITTSMPVVVVEGAIDSLFIPNSIALAGASCNRQQLIEAVGSDNIIIALDNEPRKSQTVRMMQKFMRDGFRVVLWDIDPQYKDINSMVIGGICIKEIIRQIFNNSYTGINAELHFSQWRKAA